MIFTKDYLFENYSKDKIEEKEKNKPIETTPYLGLNGSVCSCSLHSSEIYLFRMNDVEAFIKNRLNAYLRKEEGRTKFKEYFKDGYRYVRYFIDINALEKHCRGDVKNKLWQCMDVCKQVEKDIERSKDPKLYDYMHSQASLNPPEDHLTEDEQQWKKVWEKEDKEYSEADLAEDPGKDVKMEDGGTYGEVRDSDAYEQIEIVVLSNEYAALVSTWNFITFDDRRSTPSYSADEPGLTDSMSAEMEKAQSYRLNKLLKHKPLQKINPYIKSGCEKEVEALTEEEHLPSIDHFISKSANDEKYREYFDYVKDSYSNCISMLLDVIINESLDAEKYKEITFIYPKEGTLALKKYDSTNGWGVEDFCDTKSAPSFKYVVLNSNSPHSEEEGEEIIKNIESYLSSGKENLLAPSTRYNLEDSCYTCSLPDGQSVVIFNIDLKTGERRSRALNYLDYRFAYLDAVYRKMECTLLGDNYVRCLKSMDYGLLPNENETDAFLGKLKLLKNDTDSNVFVIAPDSIATLWYQKTNTFNMAKNLEDICNYVVDNARDKRSKKQQSILSIISLFGGISLVSLFWDSWSFMSEGGWREWVFWGITFILCVFCFFGFINLFFERVDKPHWMKKWTKNKFDKYFD